MMEQVEVDLVGADKGLVEGHELSPEVLGVGVQLFPQVLSIGGHHLFHQICSLTQLNLDLAGNGGHAFLEVLQVLVHLLLQVVSVGPHLGLQVLHALLQAGLQLLTLLHQGGPQGFGVQGVCVGGQLLLELIHSLLDLGLHVVGVGLNRVPDCVQLLGHTLSQHVSLCGDFGDQVLSCRGKLLLEGDCILAGQVSTLCQTGARGQTKYVRPSGVDVIS